MIRCILLGLGWFVSFLAHAQADSLAGEVPEKLLVSYQVSAYTGFIFAHSQDVQNTKGARPRGPEASIAVHDNRASTWNVCHCVPTHNFSLSYHDFDNLTLGKGIGAAYALEPWYRITKRNYVSVKGGVGAIYLTHKYDPVHNPENQSYSTAFNAYLLFGAGWWRRLSDKFWIAPHVMYQHASNGGWSRPNKGINWPTASLTLSYFPETPVFRSYSVSGWKRERNVRVDIGMLTAVKRVRHVDGKSVRHFIAGAHLNAARQVGRISNVAAGIEAYRDGYIATMLAQEQAQRYPWQVGIMAGHEFLLGKFLFTQRVGMYLYQPLHDHEKFFHRWTLLYKLTSHWNFGISLKVHGATADYTDLRINYSF